MFYLEVVGGGACTCTHVHVYAHFTPKINIILLYRSVDDYIIANHVTYSQSHTSKAAVIELQYMYTYSVFTDKLWEACFTIGAHSVPCFLPE